MSALYLASTKYTGGGTQRLRYFGTTRVATEVDHIQPLSRGGGHEWDNLQALCKSCHSKKTARETGFTRG